MVISFDFYWKYTRSNFIEIRNYIVNRSFPFNPEEFILDDDYSFDEGNKLFKNIDELSSDEFSMSITGNANGKRGRLFLNVFEWVGDLMIKIHISAEILSQNDFAFYQQFIAIEQLLSCFIYNKEDEEWQSESRISEYERKGVPHSHLPKTRDKTERLIIDTSKNWGHCFHLLDIKFVAAGKMFFGKKFYGILDEAILLSNGGRMTTKGKNELIEIDLFDPFSTDYEMIRKQQYEFLSNTGLFDKLQHLRANHIGYNQMLKSLGYGK